jgi:predicted RNA binding protein with dsRBD fold (UPF0201 family)
MDQVSVQVEVEINPTESEEKVKRAVENMFGNVEFETKPLPNGGSLLTGLSKSIDALTKLQNLLRRERIRDASRKALYEGLGSKSLTFYLNKQVAYVDHVSFCKPTGESPLGPIKVEVQCDNPRELINWLAPRTI